MNNAEVDDQIASDGGSIDPSSTVPPSTSKCHPIRRVLGGGISSLHLDRARFQRHLGSVPVPVRGPRWSGREPSLEDPPRAVIRPTIHTRVRHRAPGHEARERPGRRVRGLEDRRLWHSCGDVDGWDGRRRVANLAPEHARRKLLLEGRTEGQHPGDEESTLGSRGRRRSSISESRDFAVQACREGGGHVRVRRLERQAELPAYPSCSLGIILLEVALKIDPPTGELCLGRGYRPYTDLSEGGEAWIKLRNDDFSDVLPHFILRGERPVPNGEINESTRQKVLSPQLVDVVKALMQSNAEERCTNDDLLVLGPIRRMRRMQRINPVRQERKSSSEGVRSSLLGKGQVKEKVDGRTVILPALAPQPEEWLAYILGEDNSRRSEEGRLSGDGSWRSGRSSLESAVWASGGSGVGRVQSIKWSASPVMRRNVELREEKARREASELKRRENGWKI